MVAISALHSRDSGNNLNDTLTPFDILPMFSHLDLLRQSSEWFQMPPQHLLQAFFSVVYSVLDGLSPSTKPLTRL